MENYTIARTASFIEKVQFIEDHQNDPQFAPLRSDIRTGKADLEFIKSREPMLNAWLSACNAFPVVEFGDDHISFNNLGVDHQTSNFQAAEMKAHCEASGIKPEFNKVTVGFHLYVPKSMDQKDCRHYVEDLLAGISEIPNDLGNKKRK